MRSLTRTDWINLAIILTVALAARLFKLGDASLWLDESVTIQMSRLPLSTLWVSAYDPTPPLYYSIIKFMLSFGHSEFLLRFPSVVFGVLTVGVIYLATQKLAGTLAAFGASLFLALSSYNIEFSQEARTYALLGLCLSVSFYGVVSLAMRWNKSPSGFTYREFFRSGAGLYALGLILALYSHNTAVFYWAGVQFFFVCWWVRPFRFGAHSLMAWSLLNLGIFLVWLPWLLASLKIMDASVFSWLQQFEPEMAFNIWRSVHGMPFISRGQPYVDLFLLILGLIGLYGLRYNYAVVLLMVGLLLCSSVVIWAYGLIGSPVYMVRTILWGSLFSGILLGVGISQLPKAISYGILAIGLSGAAFGVYHYFEQNQAENADWRSAALVFKEKQRPNDILLFRAPYISRPFLYYVEDYSPGWKILGWNCSSESPQSGSLRRDNGLLGVKFSDSESSLEQLLEVRPNASLWVVHSHCHLRDKVKANGPFAKHWRIAKVHNFAGVALYQLIPARKD